MVALLESPDPYVHSVPTPNGWHHSTQSVSPYAAGLLIVRSKAASKNLGAYDGTGAKRDQKFHNRSAPIIKILTLSSRCSSSPLANSKLMRLVIRLTMTSLGTSKGVLEIAKFAVYVTVPIGLMYFFANNTKNLNKFMGAKEYVVYPPEGPRPQSPEELREMAWEMARKRATQ
ncbi:hypothetical protein LXL04_031229 [Taraxacum kok-saghyz]